jgi:xanthine dehydrogenase small subunit
MRSTIEFVLNGERVSLAGDDASRTLLTWLRERRGLVGTKEGCAEGDCGACTVVVADQHQGKLRYQPVNACILCVGALDGKELVTVDGLRALYDGALHPVQKAMVDCHGSQCGFCTPGFVMALYAHYKSDGQTPLADAIADRMREDAEDRARLERLAALPHDATRANGFFAPTTAAELASFLSAEPDATILAGGTDIGLLITKQHRDLERIAYVGKVAELKTVAEHQDAFEIGAAVTYAEAYAALAGIHPDIGELLRRLGAVQVRAAGTLAGNVANGSPIGDSMPVLLALGSSLILQKGTSQRSVALEDFYTGYRKSVLRAGEFIRSVRVPKLAPDARFAAYKVSKRLDQDISAVCAAFCVDSRGARFGFGGMAATPAHARRAETAWARGVEAACAALAEDFKPLSDQRASSWYRLTAAQNLLRKFHAQLGARALLEVTA